MMASPAHHAFMFALALAFGVAGTAQAQTSGAKPTCAAGDPVVWENTNTKVYHLSGDSFYGNTKHGAYACKSTADSAGFHLAGGKRGAMTGAMTGATPSATSASPAPMDSATPPGHHKHHHKFGAMASPAPSPSPT
jgi:hypothetical protein